MQFSANETVQAICRTLFHSLWQGLLLAIAGGIVVLLTKKLRAAVRYNVLTALLVVFAVGITCTFCCQLSSIAGKSVLEKATNAGAASVITGDMPAVETLAATAKPASINTLVINWLTANAGAVVLAWLLIIAFRCLQMFIGLRGIYILRHRGLTDAGGYWTNRVKQLAKSLQLTKPVRLMQSAIAKVPMVTGHLKPIILLPLGVLTALPQDEIEAILLHELAHIRRKDYLVNMLQNLCEIIFFFNPAVLWISSLIKDERENCCDDIAIGTVKNKKQFIHALISFQEYNLAATNYVVGFPGRKDHLLNRVKRIVTNNNKSLNNMEKTLLATGIVILSFITIAFAHAKQTHAPAKKADAAQNNKPGGEQNKLDLDDSAADTLGPIASISSTADTIAPIVDGDTTKPKKKDSTFSNYSSRINSDRDGNHSTVNTDYEGKSYRIVEDEDTLTDLYVDGERIPNDKLAQYQPIVDKIKEQVKEEREQFRRQQEAFRQQQGEFRKQQEQFREQQRQFSEQQRQFSQQQRENMRRQDSLRNNQFREQQRQLMEQQRENMRRQDTLRVESFRRQQEQFRLQQQQFREQQKEFMRQQEQLRREQQEYGQRLRDSGGAFIVPPLEPMAPVSPMAPMAPVAPSAPTEPIAPAAPMAPVPPAPLANKTIKGIVKDLKDNNIITNTDDLTLTLSTNGLTVNGEKQPAALFEKLKGKYLKGSSDHVIYESTGHGHHIHSDISINGDQSDSHVTNKL